VEKAWDKLWPLAQRYWFDALIVVGLGISIAVAVTDLDKPDAPNGRSGSTSG
jgi:hypothetical protein